MPSAPKESPGVLPIVALILSFLVAPLGLVLGIVSILSARRRGHRAPVLGVVATVVGALWSVIVIVIVIVAMSVGASLIQTGASDTELELFCQRYASDPTLTAEIQDAVDQVPAAQGTQQEGLALSARLDELAARLAAVRGDGGESFQLADVNANSAVQGLERLAEFVAEVPTANGVAVLDPALMGAVAQFESAAADLCSR